MEKMTSFWQNGPQSSCSCTLLTRRSRETEERRSSSLSCFKSQLSLMRDRDKRPVLLAKKKNDLSQGNRMDLEWSGSDGNERESFVGTKNKDVGHLATLSFEQLPKEKTNGLNTANNYDLKTSLKYLGTSVPFSLSSIISSCRHLLQSIYPQPYQRNHNDHYKDCCIEQYTGNNNSNGNGKEQLFFPHVVNQARNRTPLLRSKTGGKSSTKYASNPFILFIVLFYFIVQMILGSAALPLSNAVLPMQVVLANVSSTLSSLSSSTSSFPVTADIDFNNNFQEPMDGLEDKLNSPNTSHQLRLRDENYANNNTRIHGNSTEDSGYTSALPKVHQQMSRRVGGIGRKETFPSPLPSEMKREPLVVNHKVNSIGHIAQQEGNLLPFINESKNRKSDSRGVEMRNKGDERNNPGLINKSNNDDHDFINGTFPNEAKGKCFYRKIIPGSEENEKLEAEDRDHDHMSKLNYAPLPSEDQAISIQLDSPVAIRCNGSHDLEATLAQIPQSWVSQVIAIYVKDSSISNLNLSLFEHLPRLVSLSVTYSNVIHVIGSCPKGLLALNISFNAIRKVDSSVFSETATITNIWNQRVEQENAREEDYNDANEDNHTDGSSISTEETLSSYFSPSSGTIALGGGGNSVSNNNDDDDDNSKFEKSIKLISKVIATPTSKTKQMTPPNLNGDYIEGKVNHKKPMKDDKRYNEDHGLFLSRKEKSLRKSFDHVQTENRRFIEEPANTNEDESSNDEEKNEDDDEPNDPDNDHETKRNKLDKGNWRKEPPSPPTSGGTECANNNKNNSLCKPRLTQQAQAQAKAQDTQDIIGERRYENENDDEEDHLLTPTMEAGLGKIKSESYTYDLDQDRTSEGRDEDYSHSLQDLRTSVLPYLESSLNMRRRKRSVDGSEDTWENEIKVNAQQSTSSQQGDVDMVVGMNVMKGEKEARDSTLSLIDVDLSHNKIYEVPTTLLELKSLNSLRLSGNQLKCDFVWEKLADWYMNSPDKTILKDGDDTFCGVVDDVRVFQFTVLGVLKAKKDVVETCNKTVDKTICHECGLYSLNKVPGHGYNLSHESPHGNVAIALKLDCSFHNLSELPVVPPQTWQLNVSGNSIKDLSSLKEPMYENLLILDADTNEITSLDGLTGTSFLEKYNYLSLQNNSFSVIPSNVLSSLKSMRGQGVTFLGANFIDCDCDVVRETKPLLLENTKKIKDLKQIYCKDMKAPLGDSFMVLKDLQYADLCYMETEESNEMYLYLVIFVELLLIFVIVAKVWHDQRTFRRTGILPWCSAKMPRLPCDAMLESVKEPPHFNRSSSTNVRSFAASGSEHPTSQSISSHVQLREVRSNSGQSEKSSQISQLSSFPSSSRTSSV